MEKGSFLRDKVHSILTKLCGRINFTVLYYGRTGIKAINPIYGCPIVCREDVIMVSPKELYLDVDYLKDEYTLLNTLLVDSPHYKLMQAMGNDKDILNTEYAKRFIHGTLDGRPAGYLGKKYQECMIRLYNKRYSEILSDTYKPIITYVVNEKRYVYDGKHRAALCAFLNREVKCVDAQFVGLSDGYIKWKYKMLNKKDEFQKTIEFFESSI